MECFQNYSAAGTELLRIVLLLPIWCTWRAAAYLATATATGSWEAEPRPRFSLEAQPHLIKLITNNQFGMISST